MVSQDEFGKFRKSGFENLHDAPKPCHHPGHNPPNMICVPPGKAFHHVCPGCGTETMIYGQQNHCKG